MTETANSQYAIYTARPTIRVDGQEYDVVSELIVSMEVRTSWWSVVGGAPT